ncbi:NRDE-2, necessary for RNA interference-domain-containing protein [Powellomyces hirtus]|nr:NRDE-2, necessary for RNA interference-domain-containing protein [Powellomyces hirtus]
MYQHRDSKEDQYTFSKKSSDQLVVETANFFIDRKGDKQNLMFSKSNAYAVPTYRRWGDFILGAAPDWCIDRRATRKSRDVVLSRWRPMNDSCRLGLGKVRYQDFKRLLREPPDVTLQKLQAGVSPTNDVNFIALSLPSDKELNSEHLVLNEDASFIEKTSQLNTRLRENPKDLSSWLELIGLQEELVKNQAQKGNIRMAVYEKQQSIYERALQELPENEKLLSGYLRTCQETWDTTALLTKWDRVLKTHSDSIDLWKQYLDYRQTNYSAFTVIGCLELYESCIDIVRRDDKIDIKLREEILLHVFSRACFMLAQSGFIERAIALYQAMIEFSCFCPPAFATQTYEQRVGMFESFWESEVPRFGEEGAVGWAATLMTNAADSVAMGLDGATPEPSGKDDIELFANKEQQEEFYNWLPLRSADEDDLEDPYRAVLFDDVSTLMFNISLPANRNRLILGFLHFLSVHFDGGISSNHQFFQDPFLHCELAGPVASSFFWPSPPDGSQKSITDSSHLELPMMESDPFTVPIKTYPQSSSTMLGARPWFRKWTTADSQKVKADGYGRFEFIRNVLLQCSAMSAPIPDALPLLLTFEKEFGIKSAQKTAKSLLKTDRMNLALWNTYAQLDVVRGKPAEARKVYETALMSYHSFPEAHRAEAPILYQMLAEMELEGGNAGKALTILVGFGLNEPTAGIENEDKPQPTKVLKARKGYAQRLEVLLAAAKGTSIEQSERILLHTLNCYALTEYLSQGLDEAQRVFEQVLESLQARTSDGETHSPAVLEEVIFEDYIRLIHRHATSGAAFKPALMRDVAERALKRFPCNIVLLTMYGWNEARTKIDNRVRRLLNAQLASKPSHVLWTFAIWAELHQRQTYNVNIVRSLFEDAVECPSSKHSVSLWYLYIEFEIREGNVSKAKALFFRAIQQCPWCKDLYMLPFRVLRSVFDDDELMDIINLMEEKELRVRGTIGTD